MVRKQWIAGFQRSQAMKADRIESYPFVCYLAYLLWITIHVSLRKENFNLCSDKALGIMKRME
jgi:hypothetical protein